MQVKVFEASDMSSGLKMVKEALGPDALILSTRTLRKGKLGVIGKSTLEITAAVDSGWEEKPRKSIRRENGAAFAQTVESDPVTYQELWTGQQDQQGFQKESIELRKTEELTKEIGELRVIINGLSRRLDDLNTDSFDRHSAATGPVGANTENPDDPVLQLLLRWGISHQVAEHITKSGNDNPEPLHTLEPDELSAALTDVIAKQFTVSDPLAKRLTRQKRISLIGSTGVGKTTTIAKLAAGYLNRFGGKVALITIDTYRIAAVEQLKVYGEIMNLPVEVVLKPRDMEGALARHDDCELILIDTAGRSPGNTMELEEMRSFFDPSYNVENHLLLSATSRETELETVIRRFSCLPIANIIFSKIDECNLLGVLLNIHHKCNIPISFLTNGQRVPEDIIIPDQRTIAELIMNNHGDPNNG